MTDEAKLSALLGSRICHDLISPIGAIGNGVELVGMSGAAPGPEMALIEESVVNANTRIRFFRIAFGAAGKGHTIPRREIAEIFTALGKAGRLNYAWAPEADGDRAEVKLAFLLIQCLESSMPYGGEIAVTTEGGNWIVSGTAPKLKPDPELWSVVTRTGTQKELSPSTVHFGLAAAELAAQDRKLFVDISETGIRATF